jgi:hypothetical protein
MKKDCLKVQEQILSSNSNFSDEVELHCSKCEPCRNMKEDWALLSIAKFQPEIPLANDFAIIRIAQKRAKSQKRQIILRRVLGYAAAAASGIAAIYTVIFNTPMSNNSSQLLQQYWNWDSFEEKIFVLDTAAEVSQQDLTVGSTSDEALDEFIENEINISNI